MISTANTTFYKAPEALNIVGVDITDNVLPFAMITFPMFKTEFIKVIVDWKFISTYQCFWQL
jgi:hypothetical protein